MEIYRAELLKDKLRRSLGTIQLAKTRLHSLTACDSTATVLVSQIRLCDILLGEIHAIRSSLEGRTGCWESVRRRPVVVRGNDSSKHPIIPRGNSVNRSRQGR
jgi:hypothetical protein